MSKRVVIGLMVSLVSSLLARTDIVIGLQYGDEGKGSMVDYLSQNADIVVRSQGGNNAGHTIVIGNKEYKLHLIPSGIISGKADCYITAGTVVDLEVLLQEIELLENAGISVKEKLFISSRAHVIIEHHKIMDGIRETKKGALFIGTTKRGIGPCYQAKAARVGLLVGDLKDEETIKDYLHAMYKRGFFPSDITFPSCSKTAEKLHNLWFKIKDLIVDDLEIQLNHQIDAGKKVILEGAQGSLLDGTLGSYPYVTSSSTIASGVCAGAGIGPKKIDKVVGVVKAFTTRVGEGPFPTEDNTLFNVYEAREVAATTGRIRRTGHFDAVLVKQSITLSGVTDIVLTKLDVLDSLKEIKICDYYEYQGKRYNYLPSDRELSKKMVPHYRVVEGWNSSTKEIREFDNLPEKAREYILLLQEICGTKISVISVGPERNSKIIIDHTVL